MDRPADIILISSRRPTPTPVQAVDIAPPESTGGRRWAGGPGVGAAVFVGGLMLIAGLTIGQWQSTASLRQVPEAVRVAEYRRALADAEQACTRPEAADGSLRAHCLDEARFLILFPDCDGRCRAVVEAILPRARR
jgi:hypothetical protein